MGDLDSNQDLRVKNSGLEEKKERKRGGALLSGAPAAPGKALGGFSSFLTSKAGVLLMVLGVGGAGVLAHFIQDGTLGGKAAGVEGPKFFPMEPSVRVRKRDPVGSRSLNYAWQGAAADQDKGNAAASGSAQSPTAAQDAVQGSEAEPATDAAVADPKDVGLSSADIIQNAEQLKAQGLAGNQRLGGQSAGGSGGSSSAASESAQDRAAQKALDANALLAVALGGAKPASRRPTAAGRSRLPVMSAQSLRRKALNAKRAYDQLKFAKDLSLQGAGAGAHETQAQYAANAFDQSQTGGGVLQGPEAGKPGGGGGAGTGGGGGGGGAISSLGTGASAIDGQASGTITQCPEPWTPDETGVCVPPGLDGTNVTPYQEELENAQKLLKLALILAIIGIALILLGIKLIAVMPWGPILLGIGAAMLGAAIAMALMAKSMTDSISEKYGQMGQKQIIDSDAAGAMAGIKFNQACMDSLYKQCGYRERMKGSQELANYVRCIRTRKELCRRWR
ncbi:MAG: hypothetical protein HY922_13330 [Elusimicrobia bacterium]|nr:hypothetical protein [Elusimicrobiota bacterium]